MSRTVLLTLSIAVGLGTSSAAAEVVGAAGASDVGQELDPGEESDTDAAPDRSEAARESAEPANDEGGPRPAPAVTPHERRQEVRTALLEVGPRLAGCFPTATSAGETGLDVNASGGSLTLVRTNPPADREVFDCIQQLLGHVHVDQPADEVLDLRFHLGAVEWRQVEGGRLGIALRPYRRQYAAGVALSVVGPLALAPGLALFFASWGAGPLLGIGISLSALGAAALVTGIVLAVRGLRGARSLFSAQERLAMYEMVRRVPPTAGHHDPVASRRLELAGWVLAAIGTASTILSAVMYPINTRAGNIVGYAVLAPLGTVLTPVGLILGLVGSVRRSRARRAGQAGADDLGASDEHRHRGVVEAEAGI